MAKVNKNKSEIRAIFELMCAKREMLIFVTPYMRFESQFVGMEGNEVHAAMTMDRGAAMYWLRLDELKMRFPYGFSFLEAPVKFIGFGNLIGKNTIKFSLPPQIYQNDDRKAYRVERVGRVTGAFVTPQNNIIRADLVDLSTKGARLIAKEPMATDALKVNDKITLSIPLLDVVDINNVAIVRHLEYRTFGVEFVPKLPDSVLESLSRWIFLKHEEERERMARIQDLNAIAAIEAADGEKGQQTGGILLVTREEELATALDKLFVEHSHFYWEPPALPPLQHALGKKPHLVIIHVADGNIDERRRLKLLLEKIPHTLPVLLLGTGVNPESLFELGVDWKVTASVSWTPEKAVFLQRLVLGILRSRYSVEESQTAPKDA